MARLIRQESARAGKPVSLLQDLCGPKIRTGAQVPASVASGDEVWLASGDGDERTIGVSYASLAEDVHPGDSILLGDGHVELRVEASEQGRVRCRVEHGGRLRAKMGVNLPSGRVKLPALTEKDRRDLEVGLGLGVDWRAPSSRVPTTSRCCAHCASSTAGRRRSSQRSRLRRPSRTSSRSCARPTP
jgi:pyruvate kinase